MRVALVCIVKNERRALREWLAWHLALGIDRIIAFDNDSDDGTREYLAALSKSWPIDVVVWPSRPGESPQKMAYASALSRRLSAFDWALFIDCDEFLVLKDDPDIATFLKRFGDHVGAIGLNWLTFGSGGKAEADYELATEAFRLGPPVAFSNNHHIKTLARVSMLRAQHVHHAETSGRYVYADGSDLVMMGAPGIASHIRQDVARLNHYQVKSHAEFAAKMARGRAGTLADSPDRFRTPEEVQTLFAALDRNSHKHVTPQPARFAEIYAGMVLR